MLDEPGGGFNCRASACTLRVESVSPTLAHAAMNDLPPAVANDLIGRGNLDDSPSDA